VIGIPSYNNARTIGHVVRAVQAGLAKYFSDRKAVLVNSDGGSRDGTMEAVQTATVEDFQSILLHHRVEPVQKITTPYAGVPGKGSAFRTVFEIAAALNAKACCVVDSDLRSITPEWVELLAAGAVRRRGLRALYHRHKYDGTITNSIIYPLTRALYGKRVRQPIGGDFGFSGRLAAFYLEKDVWETDVARFGIDIWMTTTAIAGGFTIAQAFLGAKIHDAKDPGADLSAMLFQVVGATFG
jgi:glycosyltransferase involved in cell wall biosynthesis